MSDQIASIIWLLMALLLVSGNVALRRMSGNQMVRIALIWIAVFCLLVGAITFYNRCCG